MRFDSLPGRDLPGGLRVFEASSRRTRGVGLARLDDMPATAALHLIPCRSIHTFGMRFALDLIWLDRAGRVVRVDTAVAPRRLRTCLRARSVLEVRAGSADAFVSAERDGGDPEHDQDRSA
jgi:uncharacterized membrane protein (UPF0127 family)